MTRSEFMTKAELIKKIQELGQYKTAAEAEKALAAVGLATSVALANSHDVALPHLGTFHVKTRGQREGYNPITGKPMTIAAKKVIRFNTTKSLVQLLNQPEG